MPRELEAEPIRRYNTRPDASKPSPFALRRTERQKIRWKQDEDALPSCLILVCNAKCESYFLKQTVIYNSKTRSFLLEDYCKTEKARLHVVIVGAETVGPVIEIASSSHLSVLRTSFAKKDGNKRDHLPRRWRKSHVITSFKRGR